MAVLQAIENNREINWDTDNEFLFEYQKAILQTLKELGTLNETQYQYAELKLNEQRRKRVRKSSKIKLLS